MPIEAAPLLHIMERASVVTALDGQIVVLGAAMIVAVLTLIWAPPVLRGRPARRLAAGIVAWLLVPMALLPSVLPYDHLFTESEASVQVHEQHCHGAPASCSDAPVTSGVGQFLTSEPLATLPALLAVLLIAASPMLIGLTWRPDLRPPLVSLSRQT